MTRVSSQSQLVHLEFEACQGKRQVTVNAESWEKSSEGHEIIGSWFIRCTWDLSEFELTSVILQFSFRRFLNQGNPQKPVWNPETQLLGDLCPIFRKPLRERGTETYGTYGNLRNSIYVMQEKHWLNQSLAIGFVVSGFPSFRKLGNWWKPAKTRNLFWHFADDWIQSISVVTPSTLDLHHLLALISSHLFWRA